MHDEMHKNIFEGVCGKICIGLGFMLRRKT